MYRDVRAGLYHPFDTDESLEFLGKSAFGLQCSTASRSKRSRGGEGAVSAAPIASLQAWQEFYEVIGAASAALLGAMFVVASIGSGFLTQDRSGEVRILTPTVVQLSTVLFGCALALVPSLGWKPQGVLFGFGGPAARSFTALRSE